MKSIVRRIRGDGFPFRTGIGQVTITALCSISLMMKENHRSELTGLPLANSCRDVIWKMPEKTEFISPLWLRRDRKG